MKANRHWLIPFIAAASTLTITGAATAGDDDDEERRCDIRGSWVGGPPNSAGSLVTYEGKKKRGTKAQELVNVIDPTFGLIVPGNPCQTNGAVRLSDFRGVWERAGGGDDDDDDDDQQATILSTLVGFGLGPGPIPNGEIPVCGIRITSTKTFSDDCNTLDVGFTFDFFEPTADILNDDPVASADATTQERRITQ